MYLALGLLRANQCKVQVIAAVLVYDRRDLIPYLIKPIDSVNC